MKMTPLCLLACAGAPLLFAQTTPRLDEAYGICAHVSRGEIKYAIPSFDRMNEAGMTWARTDYDWHRVQPERGKWVFDHLDALHRLAKEHRVKILPILGYNTKFAPVAWKDLDAWCEFVRRLAERYQNDLPHWEIWNEENLQGFWKDVPDGANYAKLLLATYKTIKAVNPKLTVVYGGTAGVPLKYIEDSLKAGAADGFDAIAIHPYKWTGIPEHMLKDFDDLKALLAKYGAAHKPIWITEVGWSTALAPKKHEGVFNAAFRHLGLKEKQSPIAVVYDSRYQLGVSSTLRSPNYTGFFSGEHRITLDDIASLDPAAYPVLLPCLDESFPSTDYLPAIKAYLAKGGTVLLPAGLPFYYDLLRQPDGTITKKQVDDTFLPQLHMATETWWTKKGVPEKETYQKPGPAFEGQFTIQKLEPTWRFFTAENLKPGDEFVPLVSAGTDTYHSQIAAIYKLRSDGLNGNIIAASFSNFIETVPEEVQARHLPRTYLLAFASGVEKVLWYNLRAAEWDIYEREACFGIVNAKVEPKPAFQTYKTLYALCPNGSTRPELTADKERNRYVVSWTNPDGQRCWAIWNSKQDETVRLAVKGDIARVLDDFGKPLPTPTDTLAIGTHIVYLVGPTSVTIE